MSVLAVLRTPRECSKTVLRPALMTLTSTHFRSSDTVADGSLPSSAPISWIVQFVNQRVWPRLRWSRLFGQFFRFDEWNLCRG